MFTVEEFKKYVYKNEIAFIETRKCSICNTGIGYIIVSDNVWKDSNCSCLSFILLEEVDWIEVTDSYNKLNKEAFESLKEGGNIYGDLETDYE